MVNFKRTILTVLVSTMIWVTECVWAIDIPILTSVNPNSYSLNDGGTINISLNAKSISPVNWINRSLYAPTGNIYGGGGGATYNQVSPDIWSYQWTDSFSEWLPSGKYTYSGISVANAAGYTSNTWQNINVNVSNTKIAQTPIIQSFKLDSYNLYNGGQVTATLVAESNAPIDWLNRSLNGPNGNIYGGGSGITTTQIGVDIWKYSWVDSFSKYNPSGVYTYSNISVMNEGLLQSIVLPDTTFSVQNQLIASPPTIESLIINQTKEVDGVHLLANMIVDSNSPISFLTRSLDGPLGNIYGGGSGVSFVNIGVNLWQYSWSDVISKYMPDGNYTYSNIYVTNEGQLDSQTWTPITVNISSVPLSPSALLFGTGLISLIRIAKKKIT